MKYIGEKHAEHLMSVPREHYEMEEDWKGELYCGFPSSGTMAKGMLTFPCVTMFTNNSLNTGTAIKTTATLPI